MRIAVVIMASMLASAAVAQTATTERSLRQSSGARLTRGDADPNRTGAGASQRLNQRLNTRINGRIGSRISRYSNAITNPTASLREAADTDRSRQGVPLTPPNPADTPN